MSKSMSMADMILSAAKALIEGKDNEAAPSSEDSVMERYLDMYSFTGEDKDKIKEAYLKGIEGYEGTLYTEYASKADTDIGEAIYDAYEYAVGLSGGNTSIEDATYAPNQDSEVAIADSSDVISKKDSIIKGMGTKLTKANARIKALEEEITNIKKQEGEPDVKKTDEETVKKTEVVKETENAKEKPKTLKEVVAQAKLEAKVKSKEPDTLGKWVEILLDTAWDTRKEGPADIKGVLAKFDINIRTKFAKSLKETYSEIRGGKRKPSTSKMKEYKEALVAVQK